MPSLSYKPELIKAVLNHTKPFTVRQINVKRPIKEGDMLYHFTGMRTKECKKHGSSFCFGTYPIFIDCIRKIVEIDNVTLCPLVQHWFTTTDIQGSEQDFFDFFDKQRYEKPLVLIVFDGHIKSMLDDYLRDKRTLQSIVNNVLCNLELKK